MKTFWDLTEKETAALSDEGFDHYIDIELMEKGVVKPIPPKLEEIQEINLQRETFYAIEYMGGEYSYKQELRIVFDSPTRAEQFIQLAPYMSCRDYDADAGYGSKLSDMTLKSVDLIPQQVIIDSKKILSANREKKKRNDELESEYSAAHKAMKETCESMCEERYRCINLEGKYEAVLKTWKDYLKNTEGNKDIAMNFLKKLYEQEIIDAAFKWFENE